jgi:phage terminase small subunit
MDKLTPKQRRFVDEYLVDLCATRAAIRAGYRPKTARAIGHENLTKPDIRAAIDQVVAERATRTRIAADQVLDEVSLIAFSDIRDVGFDAEGRLVEHAPGAARTVAAFDLAKRRFRSGTYARQSIRLWDKMAALHLLMKHLGLLNGPITLAKVLSVLPPDVRASLERVLVEAGNSAGNAGEKGHLTDSDSPARSGTSR